MWMVHAAGPAAGTTVPRMAILAVAVIGMFVAVMLLVLGMSRRGTQPLPGHRIRARTRHNRPGSRPPAAPLSLRPSAQRPPAAPLSLRPPAHASQDRADRAGSFGYGPPSRWEDVADDPHGWR
jgi:hypothetical protein